MPELTPPPGPANTIVPERETTNRPRRPWLRRILTGVAVGALAVYALADDVKQKVADLTVPSYVSARRDQHKKDEVALAEQKKALSDLDLLYEQEKNGTVTTGVGTTRLLPPSTLFESETITLENSIGDILASRKAEADSIDADPVAAAEAQRDNALVSVEQLRARRLMAVGEWERLMTTSTDSINKDGTNPLQKGLTKAGLTTVDEAWMVPLAEFITEWTRNVDGASSGTDPMSPIEQSADLSIDIAGAESPRTLENTIAEMEGKLETARSSLNTLGRRLDFALQTARTSIQSMYEAESAAVASADQFLAQNVGRAAALRASLPKLKEHLEGLLDTEYQRQRGVLASTVEPAMAKNAQDAWLAMGLRGIFARKLMIPGAWDLSFIPRAPADAAAYMACGIPSQKEPVIVVTCADGSPEITSVYRCGTNGYEKLTGEEATDTINGQFPSSRKALCELVDEGRWQVVKAAEVEETPPAAPATPTAAPAAPAATSPEVTPRTPVEVIPAAEPAPVAPAAVPTAPTGWYKLSDSAIQGDKITDPGLNQLTALAGSPAFEHTLALTCKGNVVEGGVVTFSLPNTAVSTDLWVANKKGCEIDGFQPLQTCVQNVCPPPSTSDGTYGTVLTAK